MRPHLIVAHWVPPEARGAFFWVQVARLVGGEPVGAQISADGYSRSVADVRTEHVLAAFDRAEEELLLGPGRARQGGEDT